MVSIFGGGAPKMAYNGSYVKYGLSVKKFPLRGLGGSNKKYRFQFSRRCGRDCGRLREIRGGGHVAGGGRSAPANSSPKGRGGSNKNTALPPRGWAGGAGGLKARGLQGANVGGIVGGYSRPAWGDCGRVKGARCEHGAPLSVCQTVEDSVTVVRSCHVVTREVRHGMAGSDIKKAPLS